MAEHGADWTAAGPRPAAKLPCPAYAPGASLQPLRSSHKRRLFGRWRALSRS